MALNYDDDAATTLWGCGCLALFLIVILVIGSIFSFTKFNNKATITDTVVKTERIQDGDDSYYLVYGKNEVYEDVDSLFAGKFNSSDFYRDIQAGHTYTFQVTGWRVPFMSWYRNIIGFQEVK